MSQEPPEHATFAAQIETEQVGPDLYRAILVMSVQADGEAEVVRVPLAGEHPTRREAEFAAKVAIEAMSRTPGDGR
ncbi:hypothetical protein CDL60_14285 [Roseateles noduli]|nr:hypothetical protein CDL60_14285 [Roseateles noduli]